MQWKLLLILSFARCLLAPLNHFFFHLAVSSSNPDGSIAGIHTAGPDGNLLWKVQENELVGKKIKAVDIGSNNVPCSPIARENLRDPG